MTKKANASCCGNDPICLWRDPFLEGDHVQAKTFPDDGACRVRRPSCDAFTSGEVTIAARQNGDRLESATSSQVRAVRKIVGAGKTGWNQINIK
ncbi:MAG: hypothetical protein K2X62_13595 [Beijerinckiaceae bacterium]|jgi:hypothetical protein|nr:hypothetical protein [Beijerinckiaceae bacterium]